MLIWIKRIAPFVIIAVAVYAYIQVWQRRAVAEAERNQKYALATARVWVASARLRSDPEEFIRYRDSLLAADSLSAADVRRFVGLFQEKPEELHPFSKLVQEYVDSLLDIEDSLALMAKDSLERPAKLTR